MNGRLSHLLPALLLGTVGLACSGGDAPDDAGITDTGPADSGVVDTGAADTGAPDTGADPIDAGFPDAGQVGDDNDDFDEALDVRKNTNNGFRGAIGAPEDRDYYFFEGTEGEFVRVAASPNVTNDTTCDTVLRLYDASENQLAENDDGLPRTSVASEIVHRLPADGRYYVQVLEFSDWAEGETAVGGRDYIYTVRVNTLNDLNEGTTLETEAGNDAASAIVLDQRGAQVVGGTFENPQDVDVYSLTLPAMPANQRFLVDVMPDGVDGYGSTTSIGSMWLTDAAGASVLARVDLTGENLNFGPAMPPGDYLLWLSHPGGAAGTNDFYVLKPRLGTENDPEVEPNDSRATADARVLELRETQMDRANFLLSYLPDGDVDWFSLDVTPATESVTAVCGSATAGSGVQGLSIELSEIDGTVTATAGEPADDLARITDAVVTSTTVYIRITKTGQDAAIDGNFVRCGLFAQPR